MKQKLTLLTIGALYIGLVAHRVWRSSDLAAERSVLEMPALLGETQERELHLVPGGKYTLADIENNGRMVPSKKYRRFQARHDFAPLPGDPLCPVTRTKANTECTWTVGGQVYEFCCPPCIDEFVRLAKESPANIQPPDAYVKQ